MANQSLEKPYQNPGKEMGERFNSRSVNCGTADIWGRIILYGGLFSGAL